MRFRKIIPLIFTGAILQAPIAKEIPLVNVRTIVPAPLEEVRYATPYNFTRTRLYPIAVVFLHPDAAQALQAVQRDLARSGLGIKIYDGYRPLSVQKRMWNFSRDERFVADPGICQGSHTRGAAVDVTLVNSEGNELPMPSGYDEFTPRAFRNYEGATLQQKYNSRKLEKVMVRHGFIPFSREWWHFDLQGWEKYPPLDISITQLIKSS